MMKTFELWSITSSLNFEGSKIKHIYIKSLIYEKKIDAFY